METIMTICLMLYRRVPIAFALCFYFSAPVLCSAILLES